MHRPLLADAFGHHVWATLRLIDVCARLTPEQLETSAPGTYGPIIDTLRHLVGSDTGYLFVLTDGAVSYTDAEALGPNELRALMEADGTAWSAFLGRDLDPDAVVVRRRPDGSETHAPVGIRLAQALHHGSDHRSQICTALTALGIEPPAIDVWDFAEHDGRLTEVPPGP